MWGRSVTTRVEEFKNVLSQPMNASAAYRRASEKFKTLELAVGKDTRRQQKVLRGGVDGFGFFGRRFDRGVFRRRRDDAAGREERGDEVVLLDARVVLHT